MTVTCRLIASLIVLALPLSIVHSAPLPDSAKLLSPDTLLMLSVNDLQQARAQFEKTRWFDLYKDPAMQPFIEKAKSLLNDSVKDEEDELLRLIVQSKTLPSGRVLMAMSLPGKTDSFTPEPTFLLLAQWGDKITQIRDAMDKRLQKQIDNGAHRKIEPYRGFEIITLLTPQTAQPEDEEDDAEEEKIESEPDRDYYCFFDDNVVYSSNLESLQFMLAQLKNAQSRTLADDSEYQKNRRAVGPVYDAELYLNLKLLLEKAFTDNDPEERNQTKKNFEAMGLNGLSCLSASIAIAPKSGTSMSGKVLLATNGSRRGILKMLELSPKAFSAPSFINPQACQVFSANLNIPAATEELFKMLSAMNPMFAAAMNSPLTPPQDDGSAGVILKDDLLDNLGERLIYAGTVETDTTNTEGFRQEQLFAIAVRDAERLGRAIAGIHTHFLSGQKAELRREYLGHTLYSIPLAQLFMPGADLGETPENTMAVAVTQTHLLLGNQKAVEKAIQQQTQLQVKPLADTEWFRKALAVIPSDAGSISIDNMQLVGKHSWTALKQRKLDGLIDIDIDNEQLNSFLSACESLPEFEQVKQYFGIHLGWIITRPDGFYLEMMDIPAPTESR